MTRQTLLRRLTSKFHVQFRGMTPVTLGVLLIAVAMVRLAFWIGTVAGSSSGAQITVINIMCLPLAVAALAIITIKRRQPGPGWQHSHWTFLARTMIGSAVGGIATTLLLAPLLVHVDIDGRSLLWGMMTLSMTTAWVVARCLQAIRAATNRSALRAPTRLGV